MVGKAILRYLAKRNPQEVLSIASKIRVEGEGNGLVLFHTDANTKNWYRFEERGQIPVVRVGKMQEYLGWIGAGISNEELERLTDVAIKAIHKAAQTHKQEAAAKSYALAQAAIFEIANNNGRIAPSQLFIDYIAVQYVIDGENPRAWDPDAHKYKVEAILNDEQNGAGFFLTLREWKELTKLLGLTARRWPELAKLSADYRKQAEAVTTYLRDQL